MGRTPVSNCFGFGAAGAGRTGADGVAEPGAWREARRGTTFGRIGAVGVYRLGALAWRCWFCITSGS